MRILYLTSIRLPSTDAQSIQVLSMAKVFGEKLGDNFLLSSPSTKDNVDYQSNWGWKRLPDLYFLPRFLRYILTIFFSISVVIKFKPSIIYTRDIGVVFFYFLFGYQVVYEIHKPFETYCGSKLFFLICKKIKIVTISQALKDYIIEKNNLDPNKVLVAHDGVFIEDYDNLKKGECRNFLREQLNLSDDAFIILYSGNLNVRGKGVELIVNTAKMCPDYYFVIVGGNNSDQSMPKNIVFIPRTHSSQIPKYLKGADVLFLPFTKQLKTWKFHSALKMFEYMASGVPILSSNLGSIAEVLNENNAFLFNPEEDVSEIVKELTNIFINKDLSIQKSQLSSQKVKEYTWEKRAEKIINFLI